MLSLCLAFVCLAAAHAELSGDDLPFAFEKEKIIHGPYIITYRAMSYDPALFRVITLRRDALATEHN